MDYQGTALDFIDLPQCTGELLGYLIVAYSHDDRYCYETYYCSCINLTLPVTYFINALIDGSIGFVVTGTVDLITIDFVIIVNFNIAAIIIISVDYFNFSS